MRQPLPGDSGLGAFGAIHLERLAWAMFLIGSGLAIVSTCRQSRLGEWIRGFLSAGDWRPDTAMRRRLEGGDEARLRHRLLGLSRAHVAAAIGIPRTAASMRPGHVNESILDARGLWHADTWYYPFDCQERSGLAVHFHNDRAIEVEAIATPSWA